MADKIKGITVEINGDTTGLSKALADVNTQGKSLQGELKSVEKLLKLDPTNTELLAQKQKILAEQIENTKTKVSALKQAQEEVKRLFTNGEIDEGQYRKFERDLISAEQQLKKLENGTKEAGGTAEKSSTKFESLGVVGAAAAHIIAEAFQAALRAVKGLGESVIENTAEVRAENSQFEQTFGDFSEQAAASIQKVAENSGILNTRLNTTALSIYAFARSSGGSVQDSMSIMSTAIQAAADAAAYYDRSLDDTTDSLMSFLKGNFANDAALGVSCTETTRNAAAMELFGQKYSELSEIQKQQTLLKMVTDAQELSGAMGQAAREADGWENVTGNLAESWKQLQAALGDSVLDSTISLISELTSELQNLTQTIEDEGIEAAISQIGETMANLANIAMEQLPQFTEMAVNIINSLVEGINEHSDDMANSAAAIVTALVEGILKIAPTLAEAAINMVATLANAIGEQLPTLVPAAVDAVLTIAQGLIDNVNLIIDAAGQLIIGLQKGIINSIPELVKAAPRLVISLASAILDAVATLWIDLPVQMFEGVADGIKNYDWADIADQWVENGADAIEDAVNRSAMRFISISAHIKGLLDSTITASDVKGNNIGGFGGGGRRETKESNAEIVKDTEETLTALSELHGNYYKEQGLAAQKSADDFRESQENALKSEVETLDSELKLHKITEAEYYLELEKYLNNHVNRNSETWWQYYDEVENYHSKQTEASQKTDSNAAKTAKSEKEKQQKEELTAAKKSYDELLTAYKNHSIDKAEYENQYTALLAQYKNAQVDLTKYAAEKMAEYEKQQQEEQQKTVKDSLTNIYNEYDKAMQDIDNKIQSYASKIGQSFTSLMSVTKDDNGNITSVESKNGITDSTKQLEAYYKQIELLQNKNVSSALLKELTSMDFDTAVATAKYWNALTDTQLANLSSNWQKNSDMRQKIAEALYADEAKETAKTYLDKMIEALEEMSPELQKYGMNILQSLFTGIDTSGDAGLESLEDFKSVLTDYMGIAVDDAAADKDVVKKSQDIGKSIAENTAEGIRQQKDSIKSALESALQTAVSELGIDTKFNITLSGGGSGNVTNNNGGNVTVNQTINGNPSEQSLIAARKEAQKTANSLVK